MKDMPDSYENQQAYTNDDHPMNNSDLPRQLRDFSTSAELTMLRPPLEIGPVSVCVFFILSGLNDFFNAFGKVNVLSLELEQICSIYQLLRRPKL